MNTLFSIQLDIPIFDQEREIILVVKAGPYITQLEAVTVMMDQPDFILRLQEVPIHLIIPNRKVIATIQEYICIDGTIEELPAQIIEDINTNRFIH